MTSDNFDMFNSNAETGSAVTMPDLDSLFAQARVEQPELRDQNFTKVVVNSLPANLNRRNSRSIFFDLIGLFLGVLAAYWFFDVTQLTSVALSLIPESIAITVSHIISLFGMAVGVAGLGWWTAEKAFA